MTSLDRHNGPEKGPTASPLASAPQTKTTSTARGKETGPWLGHLDDTPLIRDLVTRGRDPSSYQRWADQVAHTGYCSHPIRLSGEVLDVDPETGECRVVYSTGDEPDGTLLVACGNRRDTRCPSCSWTYRGDAFQLVTAGLRGGKGVPDTVAAHPTLFVTLTAPSFGRVHSRREREGKVQRCSQTRGPRPRVCRHGVKLVCSSKHAEDDKLLGQPLCRDCFDYDGAVLWNVLASQLWKRTPSRIVRQLAALTCKTVRQLEQQLRLAFVKVGEVQNRGLVHFHAILRLDTRPPKIAPGLVLPPPVEFTIELLARAVRGAIPKIAAKARPAPDGRVFEARWGSQLDVQVIQFDQDEKLTAEVVAAYVSKYATKQPEMLSGLDRRIRCEGDIEVLGLNDHLRRMIATTWRLGDVKHLQDLKLRLWAHQLGFRGHWLTKSRRYSTTFTALRQARLAYRRAQEDGDTATVAVWSAEVKQGARRRSGSWRFCGAGYRTHADAWLADTARRRTQEGRRALREERARARHGEDSHG
ncbi:MAG: replication initiation protein [Actinomycetota bacterium]|nr:replication initiation protein [Actinomycetota bacterium]